MTRVKFQIAVVLLLGITINSCVAKKDIGSLEDNFIKVTYVDSLKYLNYYTCGFTTNGDISGFLLIKKSETELSSKDLLTSKEINFSDLCDVIEFQLNNSEVSFRGKAAMSGIYEDGELIIDLSNGLEKRYYQLCCGIQDKK